MQDRPMPDRHVITNGDRKSFACMHYAIILNIRPVPDHDPVPVSPDNSAKPDSYLFSDSDIANDRCIAGYKKRHAGDLNINMHNNIGN
jgi:hypothetical protein